MIFQVSILTFVQDHLLVLQKLIDPSNHLLWSFPLQTYPLFLPIEIPLPSHKLIWFNFRGLPIRKKNINILLNDLMVIRVLYRMMRIDDMLFVNICIACKYTNRIFLYCCFCNAAYYNEQRRVTYAWQKNWCAIRNFHK